MKVVSVKTCVPIIKGSTCTAWLFGLETCLEHHDNTGCCPAEGKWRGHLIFFYLYCNINLQSVKCHAQNHQRGFNK